MSVIGIDFGNESCYVAVARAGGIETVDNDYSLRATSSTVAFGEKQRILGVPAKNQLVTNIKNTIWGFKRLVGRQYDDPRVQEEIKSFPFEVIKNPETGGVAVQVRYLGGRHTFAIEQITAMLFTKLKETTEHAIQAKISDCVISVPSYFTDIERRALLAAATMAGLNVLRLMNETAATALTYGIYKQDLPETEDKPRNVVFVDCGHSALQVFACAFNKGKLKILASASDPYIGGRNFDKVLATHFSAEFRQKYNIDPETNHRAYVRLLTEVEKLKKQMSANATKLPLNIECLMNDKDVSSSMCRADFEAMSGPLLERVDITLQTCLRDSKLQREDIHSVEIVGGTSRIPAIKLLIEKTFGKIPSTTLNQDEAVARGCALQCAILSPAYKVRDFGITDVQPYPIKLVWDETLGEDGYMEVFPQYHPVPFTRMLTFHKRDPFSVKAVYNASVPFPTPEIGTYAIKTLNSPDGQPVKLKLKARVNINGVFSICSATAYEKTHAVEETQMETEPVQGAEVPPAEISTESAPSSQESGNGDAASDGTPMNQDEASGNSGDNNVEEKKSSKKKYKTIDLPLDTTMQGLAQRDVDLMTECEGKMIAEDRREKERIDAKNTLEEYVYLVRGKLEGELLEFVEEPDRVQLNESLSQLENWLYEEGSDEQRQVYTDKLSALKNTTEPIFLRKNDHNERPAATREFDVSIQLTRKVVDMWKNKEARYEHLDVTEIEKLERAIGEAQIWLDRAREIFHSVLPFMTCPLPVSEVVHQRKRFENITHPIINKQKPKVQPPKEEQAPAPVPTDGNNVEGNVNSNTNSTPNHDQQGQAMDIE